MALRVVLIVAGVLKFQALHAFADSIATFRLLPANLAFYPQEIAEKQPTFARVQCFFGEYSQSAARSAWGDLEVAHTIEAVGDFMPRWPELVLPPAS